MLLPLSAGNRDRDNDDEVVEVDDLRVRDLDFSLDEMPDGTRFRPVGDIGDLDDASDLASGAWYDTGGIPQTCYDTFATSFLVTPGGDDDDEFIDLGYFDYDYETQGLLRVTVRVFDDMDDTAGFLDQVTESNDACASGYELTSLSPTWRVEKVTTSEADSLDLPDGVSALYRDEFPAERLATDYRDIVVVYANVAIGVTCELHAGSPFDHGDCDAVAESLAEQLVEFD